MKIYFSISVIFIKNAKLIDVQAVESRKDSKLIKFLKVHGINNLIMEEIGITIPAYQPLLVLWHSFVHNYTLKSLFYT